MPKAKKKSGSNLVKDFDKQKTKLGKGKKSAASNATKTSFKAKSIALTQQSIVKDRSSAPTSKRNLTVEELVGQTRHYSASVRKDALIGLKEIYTRHKTLASKQLGIIIPNVSRLISDDDPGVRTSLHTFLSFYLSVIPSSSIVAYSSTLLLYTTSAMSHIYPDIRLDAVRVLDLLYPVLGVEITIDWQHAFAIQQTPASTFGSGGRQQTHGERVLSCYMSLLGVAINTSDSKTATSSSHVVSSELSIGARLLILQSMQTFYTVATEQINDVDRTSGTIVCPTWFWDSFFTSESELAAFRKSLGGEKTRGLSEGDTGGETTLAMTDLDTMFGKTWSGGKISDAIFSLAASLDQKIDGHLDAGLQSDRQHLFELMSPLLISIFLDAAPSAFTMPTSATAPLSTDAQLVCAIANLSLILWRGSTRSQSGSRECLGKLLIHMSTYFPFGGIGIESYQIDPKTVKLNLAYCELVGLYSVISDKQSKKQASVIAKQLFLVQEYMINILTEEGSQKRISEPILRDQTYIDLLPTIWLLLNNGDYQKNSKEIIDALLLHWRSLRAQDHTKRLGAEFLGRLWLLSLQKSYTGSFKIRPASAHRTSMIEWLLQDLPKCLWELHGRDAMGSDMILQLLRIISSQTDGLLVRDEELNKLGKLLAPFFQSRHAIKGFVDGPYTRLPINVQRTARGLLSALPSMDDALRQSAIAVGAWS